MNLAPYWQNLDSTYINMFFEFLSSVVAFVVFVFVVIAIVNYFHKHNIAQTIKHNYSFNSLGDNGDIEYVRVLTPELMPEEELSLEDRAALHELRQDIARFETSN